MPEALPPSLIYLLGALLVPLMRGRLRQVFALAVPLVAFANYYLIGKGIHWRVELLDFELILGRADAWSLIFLHIFTVLSFIGILFIVRDNSPLDLSAGLLYAGSAMGVVMAGDLLTLFFFWELLTMGAVLCILARRTPASGRAAMRYLLVHVFGGVVLLAGLVLHLAAGGSTAFDKIELSGVGPWLMFFGFGINCAWPLLGAWLTDTYPEASIGGVVFMATYTTKTAVYVLARTFPEEPVLIWIGVAMATLPIFYAVIENDLRRVLAYSLINQVGFMIVGVGLGTALSLNGTAAHAYCHILYKALLFMSIGAVIYRTGKSKATELGGLCRSMPWTCLFCCIGAASISAFPLFSGFVSKSMIMSSAAAEGQVVVWLALLFASAGVFHHAGIKIPFFAFFSHDSGIRCKEAPLNQLLAMGIAAVLCIFVGAFPHAFLYPMLPNVEATYEPYTVGHVTDQLALLLFSALAFTLLMLAGLYPAEIRSTNLDADWIYRKGGPFFYRLADRSLNAINAAASRLFLGRVVKGIVNFFESGLPRVACFFMTPVWKVMGHDDARIEAERHSLFRRAAVGAFPVGVTAFSAVILLGLLTVYYYVSGR
ncbi:MAG: Na(+)/H(+) antiporter subunit D [Verrucomicrobiae bacterium]|nr:Na(+)/H(+) antiporter subunit D [Verrucomicrobiae bacterium]